MQFATAALFLFAAMGAIANPVEGNSEGIDVRATETIFHGVSKTPSLYTLDILQAREKGLPLTASIFFPDLLQGQR